MEVDLPRKIYQARPSVVLNIDNEYLTFTLMEALNKHYQHSSNDMPKRHYYNRFVKDFRHWTMKYVDFMHYTVPLVTGQSDNFEFPGEFVG